MAQPSYANRSKPRFEKVNKENSVCKWINKYGKKCTKVAHGRLFCKAHLITASRLEGY